MQTMIGAYNPKGELLRQGNLTTIKKFMEDLHPTSCWCVGKYCNGIKAYYRVENIDTPNEIIRGFMVSIEFYDIQKAEKLIKLKQELADIEKQLKG